MKKRILTYLLVFCMLFALAAVPAAAASYMDYADALYELGLFRGTGTDSAGNPVYELNRAATRTEALVMLIRLLGEEEAALAYTGTHPFTDMGGTAWADPYVGYAYDMGYTKGSTATTFDPASPANALMYLTFLLRALGYDDAAGDFSYQTADVKAAELGIIEGDEYDAGVFMRGDCAYTSYNALGVALKGSSTTLFDSLKEKGVVAADAVYEPMEATVPEQEDPAAISRTTWEFVDGALSLCQYNNEGQMVMSTTSGMWDSFTFYTYDSAGLLSTVSTWDYASMSAKTKNCVYDSTGRLVQLISPEDADWSVSYEYDSAKNILKELDGYGSYNIFKYNEAGQLTALEDYYSNGTMSSAQQFTYDADGKVVSATADYSSETLSYFTYKYDSEGRLVARERDFDDSMYLDDSTVYSYKDGRPDSVVTSVTGNDSVESYTDTRTLSYDEKGNLVRYGKYNFSYDGRGDIIKGTVEITLGDGGIWDAPIYEK